MESHEQLAQQAARLAESILHALGFTCSITTTSESEEISLMIDSPDSGYIIGENGSRLDDLQYILNRLMLTRHEDFPRIRVDCDHYRERSEAKIIHNACLKAEKVLSSGAPITLPPMNAYHRRLVHSALAEIPGIRTTSEEVDSRFKRITISRDS